jgi:hypothetical protein
MAMAIADYSGQTWFQGFNDIGVVVLGISADELHEIRVCLFIATRYFRSLIFFRSAMKTNSMLTL